MGESPSFPDWVAIRELTARYNSCFDVADATGWAQSFTTDGRLEVAGTGPALRGREELAAFCRDRGWGFLHMTLDPHIELTSFGARQRCNLLLFVRSAERAPSRLLATGRYDDELVRTPDGWRFAVRSVEMDTSPRPATAQAVT